MRINIANLAPKLLKSLGIWVNRIRSAPEKIQALPGEVRDDLLKKRVMPGRGGGGRGTRTPDLYSAIVALSQLSYAPTETHTVSALCEQREVYSA
jgi:hypothetical protein